MLRALFVQDVYAKLPSSNKMYTHRSRFDRHHFIARWGLWKWCVCTSARIARCKVAQRDVRACVYNFCASRRGRIVQYEPQKEHTHTQCHCVQLWTPDTVGATAEVAI